MTQRLYRPQPPSYNPQIGRVVGISRLESGRPVLHVRIQDDNYEIRAIVNSDLGYQDSIPAIGSQVEVAQAQNMWTLLRQVDVGGGGNWTVGDAFTILRRAEHLTGVGQTAITIRDGMVVANTAGGMLILDNSALDISYEFGGIHIGDRFEFHAGWSQQSTDDWYQVGVVPEARQLVTNRQNTGDPSRARSGSNGGELHNHGIAHTHSFTVNLDPPFKKAGIWADGNLVSPPGAPDPILTPTNLSITDHIRPYGSTREYSWRTSPGAVAYRLRFFHAVQTHPTYLL